MDADGLIDGLREEQLVEPEEIDGLVRDAVKQALGDNVFQHAKAEGWAAAVVEGCLKRLASAGKPFKYIVTTNLLQRAGWFPPPLPPHRLPGSCSPCIAPPPTLLSPARPLPSPPGRSNEIGAGGMDTPGSRFPFSRPRPRLRLRPPPSPSPPRPPTATWVAMPAPALVVRRLWGPARGGRVAGWGSRGATRADAIDLAGSGLHIATSQFWGPNTDGRLTVQWENGTMQCIVTVYWLAI